MKTKERKKNTQIGVEERVTAVPKGVRTLFSLFSLLFNLYIEKSKQGVKEEYEKRDVVLREEIKN